MIRFAVAQLTLALALLPTPLALAHSRPQSASRASDAKPAWPAITLEHLNTRERFVLRPDKGGHLDGKPLRGIRKFLRCHHTGKVHSIADRLPQIIYTVAHHFGDRAVSVVAGYRAPRVARMKGNPKSPHKSGLACDFKIDGVSLQELRDYLRSGFDKIGVGYYPNSGFIHLDVGRAHSAFWIDYSSPGERSSYSPDPVGDLASGRADGGVPDSPAAIATDESDDPGMVAPPSLPVAAQPEPAPRPGSDPD